MKLGRQWVQRWAGIILLLVALTVLVEYEVPPPQDLKANLNELTAGWIFNFPSWEVRALASKIGYSLASPQRFMTDEARSQFVLDYLDHVAEAQRLSSEISGIYTDPQVQDPQAASTDQRAALATLRDQMVTEGPVAEAILEEQVSQVLANANLGVLSSILPPVSGTFTPLPYILIVSPRARIESVYQQQLIAGLTAADAEEIETSVVAEFPNESAYVTAIGGLAAYPAMLLESSSIDWVADVFAHEWTHHYLIFHPLGWNYMRNGEARTINETTASLIGDWAGQEIILRYYAPLLSRTKDLPNALVLAPPGEPGAPPVFDFNAEMHHTRVVVDQLLSEGRIKDAEWYMELQRRYFVDNGYRIRKLNQAYFAFHGAYASTPGAAGSDPIGPLVRKVWDVSPTAGEFLRRMGPVASLQNLSAVAPN